MNPCVLIANACGGTISPDDIIKKILELDSLPEPHCIIPEGQVRGYLWNVDTKYYSAEVLLCALPAKSIGTEEFAEAVNAVILPFDSQSADGLAVANQWLPFLEEMSAEVKLLVCNNCSSNDEDDGARTAISKLEAQNWCVKNGFELIELDPAAPSDDSDTEDDFPESTGIKRVVQALHAHVWPNLNMKGDATILAPLAGIQNALNGLPLRPSDPTVEKKVNGDESHFSGENSRKKLVAEVKPFQKDKIMPSNVAVVSPTFVSPVSETPGEGASYDSHSNSTMNENVRPSPTRDERLEAMFQSMGSMPEDSFEELFNNLSEMKQKAEQLSPTHRKKYAEKIAIAFWKSVSGGNESEIDGLSSDDEG